MVEVEPKFGASASRFRRSVRVISGILLLVLVNSISLFYLARLRNIGRSEVCRSNLERVASALTWYYAGHGRFPPPFLINGSRDPTHSWRILLMPYLVNEKPWDFGVDQYRFDEPWDGARNLQFADRCHFSDYSCPKSGGQSHNANYLCLTGGALWPCPQSETTSSGNLWPSPSNGGATPDRGKAILLVDIVGSNVPWTKPVDITLAEFSELIRNGNNGDAIGRRVRRVVAADENNHLYFLDPTTDISEIRKILDFEQNLAKKGTNADAR
jgi:hypothetical protein